MCGWLCLGHSFISVCVAKGLTWEQIAENDSFVYTFQLAGHSRDRIESLGLDLV
jgi:hypothetical protein